MIQYRLDRIEGGTYFFTVALREAIRTVRCENDMASRCIDLRIDSRFLEFG